MDKNAQFVEIGDDLYARKGHILTWAQLEHEPLPKPVLSLINGQIECFDLRAHVKPLGKIKVFNHKQDFGLNQIVATKILTDVEA